MEYKHIFLLIILIGCIGIVNADSDYCAPTLGTNTTIVTGGGWFNITITSDTCPICVVTITGYECTKCDGPAPSVLQYSYYESPKHFDWTPWLVIFGFIPIWLMLGYLVYSNGNKQ